VDKTMAAPTDDRNFRVMLCAACGGDRGHMDYDGSWSGCIACEEQGEFEVELQPIDCDDLD
jgi:hypothetical protein